MNQATEVLSTVFGHKSFRLSQEQVVRRLVEENENALVLFPTGGGKSLTYQVPALCIDGLTLVISPLLALIKDQVDYLQSKGIKAANLDSTLTASQAAAVKQDVLNGSMKLLYVAPERLNNEGFVKMIMDVRIGLVAVDESHCISQWGSSFRPDYLKIARFVEEMSVERVLCLTATATPAVVKDICDSFHITPEGVFRTPMYRPNLALDVRTASSEKEKIDQLLPILRSRTGPAIIYVTLQRHAEEISQMIETRDPTLSVWVYHAGLSNEVRQTIQERFMASEDGIVCATIAFGMGVDKANIRQVIHLYMPKTLENYSQEVGRAGRDGLSSQCIMFLSAPDIPILEGFVRGDSPNLKSVELWLQGVFLKTADDDGAMSFNLYEQSRVHDIRSNVLGLLFAYLELDHGLLRAITPMYSIYDITPINIQAINMDKTPGAVAIRKFWTAKKNGGYTINVVDAATYSASISREEIAKTISFWEMNNYCTTKGSQVRARFRVLKDLPSSEEDIKGIAKLLYDKIRSREEENCDKLKQVITFATTEDCLPAHLSSHFGDSDAVPGGMCGMCTFCRTATAVEFSPHFEDKPDTLAIRKILNAIPDRDDPLMLTRFAFGVTSPRLTANKMSMSHPYFGSMCGTEWNALFRAFDAECKNEGYRQVAPATPPPKRSNISTGTKRKAAATRGVIGKRGRR